jgi:hypothetical protein
MMVSKQFPKSDSSLPRINEGGVLLWGKSGSITSDRVSLPMGKSDSTVRLAWGLSCSRVSLPQGEGSL